MSDRPPSTTKEKVTCPSCGELVDRDLEKCPHCDSPLGIYLPSSNAEMPEITESTFSIQDGRPIDLSEMVKEMIQKVNVLWEERKAKKGIAPPPTLYLPQHVKEVTPKEVLKIVDSIQKSYERDIPDGCPGLLRKALTSAIKIKFYMKNQRDALYDAQGNRKGDLLTWIDIAKQKGYLTQDLAKQLKRAKIFGDIGSHDEMIDFDKREVAEIFQLLRCAIEHMYKTN